jgi:hypothetical protein
MQTSLLIPFQEEPKGTPGKEKENSPNAGRKLVVSHVLEELFFDASQPCVNRQAKLAQIHLSDLFTGCR